MKKINWLVLAILILLTHTPIYAEPLQPGLSLTTETRETKMQGGNILSQSQARRSGIYEVASSYGNLCTGTILYTSAAFNKTWVLTAAHCMEKYPDDPSQLIFASWAVLLKATPGQIDPPNTAGEIFTHPDYLGVGDYLKRDLALIRFDYSIPIETSDGELLHEYFRPIAGSNPSLDDTYPFGAGTIDKANVDAFNCDDFGQNATNDETLRWATGEHVSEGNGVVSIDYLLDKNGADAYIATGDSGGPWLVSPQGASIDYLLDHGVVGAVASHMYGCGLLAGLNVKYYGSNTWGTINNNFLSTTMGSDLVEVDADTWTRTCWKDWCHYPDSIKTALILSALSPLL